MLLDLVVSASMIAVTKSSKGVFPIGWVEVGASRNGILSRVRRSAVAARQRVVLEVVVPAAA